MNERWGLLEKENAVANDTKSATTWRRGWDSNPRELAPQLISSQPRYDHFDTPPYCLISIQQPPPFVKFGGLNWGGKGRILNHGNEVWKWPDT